MDSLFKIYLITDRRLAAANGGLIAMTEAALFAVPPGTVALQLREKDLDARELLELARQLRAVCDRHHTRLIVNDRLDVAIAARADGVHLPANSFTVAEARALIGHERLVGASTHDDREVSAASEGGADFVVYGPIFDPVSKAAYTDAQGADGLLGAYRAASIPVFALGGITVERIRDLRAGMGPTSARPLVATRGPVLNEDGDAAETSAAVRSGAAAQPAGVAVIGAIYGASDPGAAMRDLVDALA